MDSVHVNPSTYISTESMIPDKAGALVATSIPKSGKARAFHAGDTLVSNIRPYFKKIWQAEYDGCCSADVLVFQPTNCERDYLYWLLSSDSFFDYAVSTSKGTKMPRGDKQAIMRYEFELLDTHHQRLIASILNPIRESITINQRTNDYLEQCLLARYDHLFGTTGAFDGTIADIGDVIGGATPSKKKPGYFSSDGIGWITPRDLSNTTDKFIAHGADDITQLGYDSCSVRMLPAGTVLFSSRAPIGYIAIAADNVTTNQGFKSVVPHEDIGTAFVYCFLKRNKDRIADAGSGTTFPEVSGKTMAGIELPLPDKELCIEFSEWAKPLMDRQYCLEEENRRLGELRDTLLPKLMSGDIDVSDIKLPKPPNNHLCG